jgi:hypothetical protein
MKNYTLRITLLLPFLALIATLAARAEPVLAGHAGAAAQSLDADAIKAVLLGKKTTLGDNRVIIVIAKTSEAQEQFLKQAIGMTTSQFQTHWRRLYMTGGGSAPKITETDLEAVKLASETVGAIVIADRAAIGGLTVLVK